MMVDKESTEASVPVSAVIVWLTRTNNDEAMRLLADCDLDDGESDEFSAIKSCDVATATLTLVGGRRVNLRRFIGGVIVDRRPGYPLLAAIDSAKTPVERREVEVRTELRRRRVDPDSLGSAIDREQVLRFLTLLEKGEVPAEPALRAFYEAMKPAASSAKHRRAAEALQTLMAACAQHGATPPSLPWRLAWFLNQSGQFDEAVTLSQSPQARALQGMHRALLATIRASALLALADIRHDSTLLDQAESALKIAYAIDGGSDEVRALYRKLNQAKSK